VITKLLKWIRNFFGFDYFLAQSRLEEKNERVPFEEVKRLVEDDRSQDKQWLKNPSAFLTCHIGNISIGGEEFLSQEPDDEFRREHSDHTITSTRNCESIDGDFLEILSCSCGSTFVTSSNQPLPVKEIVSPSCMDNTTAIGVNSLDSVSEGVENTLYGEFIENEESVQDRVIKNLREKLEKKRTAKKDRSDGLL